MLVIKLPYAPLGLRLRERVGNIRTLGVKLEYDFEFDTIFI
jgi:hypothetical protein